jgi:small subunit ribosomal protein S4
MPVKGQPKHKLCRRIGFCIWDNPKCPSVKRPYPAGSHGKTGRKKKLSTYGELLLEKQKLREHYGISEKQLVIAYKKAKKGEGRAHEKLFRNLEMRLDAVVFRSGFAPSIYAAKQFVNHRHILVDGEKVDRSSYRVKEGQVISINSEKSPSIAETAKNNNTNPPAYLEVDKEQLKVTALRNPELEEIPVNVEIMRVIEYYAR